MACLSELWLNNLACRSGPLTDCGKRISADPRINPFCFRTRATSHLSNLAHRGTAQKRYRTWAKPEWITFISVTHRPTPSRVPPTRPTFAKENLRIFVQRDLVIHAAKDTTFRRWNFPLDGGPMLKRIVESSCPTQITGGQDRSQHARFAEQPRQANP